MLPDTPHISLHAILGNSPQKPGLQGKILNKDLTISVDGGSTHNFIQDKIAKLLGLSITHSKNVHVLVSNGDRLQYNRLP